MADVMALSTTTFFIRPEHEAFLRAFADVLSNDDGIDGYYSSKDGGVSLAGDVDDGFTLLCWGVLDGTPRMPAAAFEALLNEHEAYREAFEDVSSFDGDEPVEIGEVLQAALEPDTHVILRCYTAAGAYEYYSVTIYHADGDSSYETLPDIEARLRAARGVSEVEAKAVKAARAKR